MSLSAPDLVLSIADSVSRPVLGTAQLIAAGELFGVDSRAIRVALTRLTRTGVLTQRERGRYGLGPKGDRMHAAVVAWDTLEETVKPWTGGWVAVHTGPLKRTNKTAVRNRERAMRLKGFVALEPGLWLRPDNLSGSIDDMRAALVALGLDESARVLSVTQLTPSSPELIARMWNRTRLERGYRQSIERLERSAARTAKLSVADAARETLLLGRATTADILTDPLLPEEMVDVELRRRLNAAMRDYNRLGRAAWKAFYASLGAA